MIYYIYNNYLARYLKRSYVMNLTLMTPILLVYILLTVLSSTRRGYKKGSTKSAVSFAVTIASAFLGAGLAMLMAYLLKEPVFSLLEETELTEALEESIGAFAVILEPLVSMVSSFVLFLPCFSIVHMLLSIIVSIVFAAKTRKLTKTDGYHSEDVDYYTKSSNRLGALFGAAAGLFTALVVLSPITGIMKCATGTVDLILEFTEMDEDELLSEEFEDFLDLSDDFMVTAIDACGGRMWFNLSTSTYCYGQWTNINKEIAFFTSVGMDDLTDVMESISELDDDSLDTLDDFLERTNESPILRLMLTAAVNDMSKAWIDGDTFMEIPRPEIGEGYINDFFNEILAVLAETDTNTVESDLTTLLRLCNILREYEFVFDSDNYEAAADAFADGKLLDKIKREISKNPRMANLETMVNNIIMSSLAVEIDDIADLDPAKQEALFTDLSQMINSSVTVSGEKRAKALATDIYAALSEYGVYAPEDMVEEVSSILITSLSAKGESVTPEQVRAYFDAYYR